jgi:hypothetical protein
MIQEIKYYSFQCDNCGEYSEPTLTIEVAQEIIDDGGWLTILDKHYCQDCREEFEL